MDTSGFYKLKSTNPSQMIAGPNYVLGPYDSFSLDKNLKDTYVYPIEGWFWFDSEEEACVYFNISYPPEIETMGLPSPISEEENINLNIPQE